MMTVLLVADDDLIGALRPLIHDGPHYRVISHAGSPPVALAQARVLLPDIVIIDTAVPGTPAELAALFQELRDLDPPSGVIWHVSGEPAVPARLLDETEGAVHAVRHGDQVAMNAALRAIGLRRASCDPDQPA
ncbi:hypothetical protein [Streptomyces sp. NPDC002564]|uniref:hypothetical protein n=1 Tax=Streptomyces sp. NPDC002564 TaxID=3364649 RepID=UPI0036C27BF6